MATKPTIGFLPGNDPGATESRRQYEEAYRRMNDALLARQGRMFDPQMLALAEGFLSPTMTGSFGESLGMAAKNIRQAQAQEEKELQDIASAQFQLAGQKFQMDKEARALELVADAMGTTPEKTAQSIATGEVAPDLLSKLTPDVYLKVSRLDPKLGTALKDAFQMDVERRKAINEDIKTGLNYADLLAKYGRGVTRYIPPGLKIPGMPGQEAEAPAPAPPTVTGAAPRVAPGAAPTRPAAQAPAAGGEEDLPLGAQAELRRKRGEMREEEAKPLRADIVQWTPQAISLANNRLDELIQIANDREGAKVFGLLQKQGILPAIAAAAQEAVRVGQTSVQFPVQQFVEKIKLTPEQQRILRRASQLLTEEFFESAKLTRSVLGPQMSNADTIIQQKPMATIEDAASTVDYWAKQRKLLNYQRQDMFKALQNWDRRVGLNAPSSQFFSSPQYESVTKRYEDLQKQFRERFPGFGAK